MRRFSAPHLDPWLQSFSLSFSLSFPFLRPLLPSSQHLFSESGLCLRLLLLLLLQLLMHRAKEQGAANHHPLIHLRSFVRVQHSRCTHTQADRTETVRGNVRLANSNISDAFACKLSLSLFSSPTVVLR